MHRSVHLNSVNGRMDLRSYLPQALDLRLKWPNDIYTGDMVKIGGVLTTCSVNSATVVCNIGKRILNTLSITIFCVLGCGINLNNDSPTTCLNSQIEEYNKLLNQKLPKLTREKVLALTFSKLEEIIDRMQEGDVSYLHELYYFYWLHRYDTFFLNFLNNRKNIFSEAQVNVFASTGGNKPVVICGIDEYGYLRVREQTGREFSVQPDGNSFDMMEGLITPKEF